MLLLFGMIAATGVNNTVQNRTDMEIPATLLLHVNPHNRNWRCCTSNRKHQYDWNWSFSTYWCCIKSDLTRTKAEKEEQQ